MTKSGRRRDTQRSIVRLSAGFAFVLLVAACDDNKSGDAKAPPPPDVKVASVESRTVPIVFRYSGTLSPINRVNILPRVSGYITERSFVEGDFVDSGTKLYQIDPRPFQDAVDESKAQLEIDQANVVFTKKELDRFTILVQRQAVAQEQLDAKQRDYDNAAGSLARTKASLASNELNLSFTTISAPFSGRVQQTQVDVGQLVTEGADTLTTLLQTDPIYVIFNASSVDYYEVQKLQAEGVATRNPNDYKVEILLPDGSSYPQAGHLDFVSSEVDPQTDTLTLRGVIPNPRDDVKEPILVSGQYVPVKLTVGERPNSLVIPQQALVETQVGQQVYVVGGDNKVALRDVKILSADKNDWIVSDGLKEGEHVVIDGLQKIRDGILVNPTPTAKKEGSPSEASKEAANTSDN